MGKTQPVMSLSDRPMWDSIAEKGLKLQFCCDCGTCRYPPAPICPDCLSMEQEWRPVSGRGKIMSWVVFHRKYFEDFPPPFNAVSVRIEEGPIIVTNLVGDPPDGSWIGRNVQLEYIRHEDRIQHAARIVE